MPDESPDTVILLACRNVSSENGCYEEPASSFELSYLVYDQTHAKIVSSVEKIIEPLIPEKEDDVQSCLSDETELSESEDLRSILQQLELHFEKEPVDVFTFGPLALRHFLHSQAVREKIKLHEGLYSYIDVSLEFKRTFPEHEQDAEDIDRIVSHLNINLPSSKPQGLELCKIILQIMQQLPSNVSRQIIRSQYSHVKSSSPLLEDTIVRVRGFSPSTTEVKLARFFSGLNIESGGILMCMNANGRPSCDALVRLTNKEQRDLALKRNGSKFGSRNLEICKASVQEFSRIMNQDPSQEMPQTLNNFLHLAAPAAVIIRMRGLPYNTKASEIVTFFGDDFPVFRGENGIFFVYHPDGRPTGDAFVLFETVEHGKQALTKHRQTIGKRYVELFQTSRNEVVQIFSRYSAFPASGVPTAYPIPRPSRPTTEAVMQNKGYLSNNKDIIRLRGLPYAASVQDILDFLNEFSKYVVPAGVHMVYNLQGRPSGDAFIEMRSAEHAQKASESLHKKHIGERYIEVFQCSSADMAFMLMHGIPNYRHQQHNTWVNRPYSPRTPPLVPSTFTYPPVSSSALSYPPISSPPSVSHASNTAHGPMISIPPSPTISPTGRVFMTSPSPGYVTYPTSPYNCNVFNFTTYPPRSVAVEAANMGHTEPMMSPAPYDTPVFIPGYQVNKDFAVAQMDPSSYIAINHYLPPTNGYYPSNEIYTEPGHIPAYVETYVT